MNAILSRRGLLGAGGALFVAFGAPALAQVDAPRDESGSAPARTPAAAKPPLTADQLDSWIAVQADGSVTAFFGKVDVGQALEVAIAQIVADELDVAHSAVTVVMGDSASSVNQGGASGSFGVEKGGITLRYAAAEARRVLLTLAAQRLGTEALEVTDGVVSVRGDAARTVSYGELIGGRFFDVPMQWNGKIGNELVARGVAEPKRPDQYRVVGQSIPRTDIREKVFGRMEFVTDIRLPNMLHARVIRPPVAGAVPVSVDENSIRDIPGARVVQKGGLLAVLAEREWNAIRASTQLAVTWSDAAPAFPGSDRLYEHIRDAPVVTRREETKQGNAEAAITGAARVVEAEYHWPFQSHASMGPACAVADVRADGATLWTGSQKPHFGRDGVAAITGLPVEKVRAIFVRGPGSYGRNDAGDAALDAAVLSQEVGRPVRLQYMRADGTAWDPKGPASIHRCRAGLDAQGRVVGYSFISKGFSRVDIDTNESDPRQSLAGQMNGQAPKPTQGFAVPAETYDFENQLLAWETIPPLLAAASPLRTSHLRDPLGPQINFASEGFIDELAAVAGADPVQFRLDHMKSERGLRVLRAAAERAGWQPRPAARQVAGGEVVQGRGVAYAQRVDTIVAAIVTIEVNRRTGAVRPLRWVVAHDCGLVINPNGTRLTVEGNIVHATSRALWEEITFDERNVTSTDWMGYPMIDITEAPEGVEVVLVNRPDQPPTGAGEASSRPVAAAIGNAIFDATGVRLRQAPFTPERVKAALARA
ncbi:molybdopterin cofactor-binding domain-containing protein [Roseomonas sp. BN140053]|uniref:xanthine dehydrogenase family protein molybdopterin-binding subunit n=1 Tax=Roseomonas sp. BN140053 TaxID=3391898 RepID=UPI0039ECCCB7